jgi:peptide deformylase
MAVRNIITEPNPVLHARAQEVTAVEVVTPEFRQLIVDMVETMRNHGRGVGLAGPQIGVSKRVFVAESPDGAIALVNPVFTAKSWKMTKDEEGCLSVPGKFDKVMRHKAVSVKALNADGQPIAFAAEGFFARILQHETDHLDGILFTDRVEEQRKKRR